MTLIWPWSLLGLGVVAAVAVWTLLRPGRRLVSVGGLALWRQAADALERSKRRRSRKAHLAWLCLLLGAVAAVAALARPVYRTSARIRRVAVAVYPSAELAGHRGCEPLRAAAGQLLDRLDDDDAVQILLPVPLVASEGSASRKRAREIVAGLKPLPMAARDMVLPAPSSGVQHVYHVGPAGGIEAAGTNLTVIEIPTDLPPVTIDALGAADAPGRKVQVFVALRNHTDQQWQGHLVCKGYADNQAGRTAVNIPPGERKDIIISRKRTGAIALELTGPEGPRYGLGARGYLVRREKTVRKVAIVGADDPLVRRYVRADPMVELVGDAGQADVVVANRAEPPDGKPALVIDPRSGPAGMRRGKELNAVELANADVDSSDPVTRYVDLSQVAVRRLRPWVAWQNGAGKRLVSYQGVVVIVRSGPAAKARRVFVAFDLSPENTNFAATDAFVIFMANAMRWLAPGGRGTAVYEFASPVEAGPRSDWKRIGEGRAVRRQLLPWPGIYRRGSGGLEAISVTGLKSGRPRAGAAQAIADAPLPRRQFAGRDKEFWAALAVIATAFWLAGWALRMP